MFKTSTRLKAVSLFLLLPLLAGWNLAAQAETAESYFQAFQAKNDLDWSGGDQVTSFKASNGALYWLFGDTAVGTENPVSGGYNPGWRLISNKILVQRGTDIADLQPATDGVAIPDAANGERYWAQGMFEANGFIYVLAQRVGSAPDGGFSLPGVELAKFEMIESQRLRFIGMLPTASTGIEQGYDAAGAQYSGDAVVDGGFVYFFGFSLARDNPFSFHYGYVARVRTASVEDVSGWRFWNGSAWVKSMAAATPIIGSQISSVNVVQGRWVILHKPFNGFGDTVYADIGRKPYGPFQRTELFKSPAGVTPEGRRYQTYSPQLHPEQVLDSGRILASIAWNGVSLFKDVAKDADLYKPRFYELTLP